MALQMLYQIELGGSSMEDVFESFDLEGYLASTDSGAGKAKKVADTAEAKELSKARKSLDYACRLVRGVHEHQETIDESIRRQAENWRLERMPTIDRGILRLAVYEMNWEENVPKVVIVDEAIELAKKFGAENSGRFVNGLLDGILQGESPSRSADSET